MSEQQHGTLYHVLRAGVQGWIRDLRDPAPRLVKNYSFKGHGSLDQFPLGTVDSPPPILIFTTGTKIIWVVLKHRLSTSQPSDQVLDMHLLCMHHSSVSFRGQILGLLPHPSGVLP